MNQADIANLWNNVWPVVTGAVAVASVLDAALPQPAPGSHFIPLRKLISFVAVNIGNASSGDQPAFSTWLSRILRPLLQAELAKNAEVPQAVSANDTVISSVAGAQNAS